MIVMCNKIYYVVFSFLALSMAAGPVLAEVIGVGEVVMDGTFLVSATTADGYTITVEQLRNGTTTAPGGVGAQYPPEWADDFDFSNAASNIDPYTTELFGGKNWINVNGDAPDFFIFEAAGSRQVTDFRALFPDDSVGEPLIVQTAEWIDTGVSGAFGQTIAGIAFSITDLKDTEGNNLTSSAEIKGIVTGQSNTGVDPVVIAAVVGKLFVAYGPNPPDGAFHKDTWVTLNWSAGDFDVSHDVYLGDNFDDIENATRDSGVFRGNQVTTFYVAGFPGFAYPEGLVPGTTYYWRIDEVNDADPADDTEVADPNSVTLSWTAGYGAILHTVYFGDSLDEVNDATVGIPSETTSYPPGQLEREKVYYWRVDEFDAAVTHKGDIWTFTTPGAVGNPLPAYAATDVQMNPILNWTPADSAASHQLYFGTDKDAVRSADTGSPEYVGSKALGAESHDPGLLEPDATYYWRVDEVDGQGNTSKGPLWIFTTGGFLLIDDFEGYTDDDAAGEAIWQTWIDGFGIPDNGAQVGYLMPPYAEQTNVHSGSQSMPLMYVNEAGVTNSEASLTLTAPQDWTQAGIADLSLWFKGSLNNAAEPMYVAISNSAGAPVLAVHDDARAAQIGTWMEWRVPLQAFADQGINLTNVDKIAIGLGNKGGAAVGGSGTMYIDDIRLYQP